MWISSNSEVSKHLMAPYVLLTLPDSITDICFIYLISETEKISILPFFSLSLPETEHFIRQIAPNINSSKYFFLRKGKPWHRQALDPNALRSRHHFKSVLPDRILSWNLKTESLHKSIQIHTVTKIFLPKPSLGQNYTPYRLLRFFHTHITLRLRHMGLQQNLFTFHRSFIGQAKDVEHVITWKYYYYQNKS
jgi:hypothetical protein